MLGYLSIFTLSGLLVEWKTYAFGTGSRYLHSNPLSRQVLHGFVSSHFALS